MESLPDIEIPDAAKLPDDRSPAPPPEMEQCISRCKTSIRRLEAWLTSGKGTRFTTYHPAAFQQMFSDKCRANFEDKGYTVTFEGDTLIVQK